MAEPTTSVASTAVAGITATVVALLGVEPQALAWAMVGAVFGAPLAPPSGRVRQVAVFGGVVLACALLGTIAAEHFNSGAERWRNGWALVLGGLFHPISAALVQAVPGFVTSILSAIAARRGEGGGKP